VPQPSPSEKRAESTDELHERARKVQELLSRLLTEINELLCKTKRMAADQNAAGESCSIESTKKSS
jgi:hypothetical protein